MSLAHDRILEILLTCDESADTVLITDVRYYRTRGDLDASTPKTFVFTAGSAAANHETEMGEVMPPPTHIRLVSTFQA